MIPNSPESEKVLALLVSVPSQHFYDVRNYYHHSTSRELKHKEIWFGFAEGSEEV